MSDLANHGDARLLPPFWPVDDQHGIGHVNLDAHAPTKVAELMPLLLRLAALSEAMRDLQTSDGVPISGPGAAALKEEMAEGLGQLAELVDEESAAVIRMRADALAGRADEKETILQIAADSAQPPLEIVCGSLCTWRHKTRSPLHSFLAATHNEEAQQVLDALDDSLEKALDELRDALSLPGLKIRYPMPMHATDLIASAGEAAGHPKHFAYFMPEDEGIDGLPPEEQRTLYLHNVHHDRFQRITAPLAEALLEGPMRADEVPLDAILPAWIRGHDHGHNLIVAGKTDYSWDKSLGTEPFMMLQEAIANVYGFLMLVSEPWLRIAEASRLEMCATHMAEMLHYLRRGPQYFGDPGAAYVELSFLAENGFVEIDSSGRVRWNEEDFSRGMTALASALTESTVAAPDKRGSVALIERYGSPAKTAAERTLRALQEDLGNVPTSLAFYNASDVATSEGVPVAA